MTDLLLYLAALLLALVIPIIILATALEDWYGDRSDDA